MARFGLRKLAAGQPSPFRPGDHHPGALQNRHDAQTPPRSGVTFRLDRGQRLRVTDPQGEQVSDLLAFNTDDPAEVISSGRTLDYAGKLFLSTGDPLYSNRSNVMLLIPEDTVGRRLAAEGRAALPDPEKAGVHPDWLLPEGDFS